MLLQELLNPTIRRTSAPVRRGTEVQQRAVPQLHHEFDTHRSAVAGSDDDALKLRRSKHPHRVTSTNCTDSPPGACSPASRWITTLSVPAGIPMVTRTPRFLFWRCLQRLASVRVTVSGNQVVTSQLNSITPVQGLEP